jgi:hypothetical protein
MVSKRLVAGWVLSVTEQNPNLGTKYTNSGKRSLKQPLDCPEGLGFRSSLPRARPPVPHECGPHDAKQQFTITMTPVDGKGPVGTITGSRSQSDGWLLAEVKGSGCTDGSVR